MRDRTLSNARSFLAADELLLFLATVLPLRVFGLLTASGVAAELEGR